MNRVVDQLLEADRKARQLLDEAQQYYDKTLEEIKEERRKILSRYEEGAALRVQQVEQVEGQQVDDSIASIAGECDRLTEEMEAVYQRNHASWEESLFRRCIGAEE